MASAFEDKFAGAAKSVAKGVERAVELVKDKTGVGAPPENRGVTGIQDEMDVIASFGRKVVVPSSLPVNVCKHTGNPQPLTFGTIG